MLDVGSHAMSLALVRSWISHAWRQVLVGSWTSHARRQVLVGCWVLCDVTSLVRSWIPRMVSGSYWMLDVSCEGGFLLDLGCLMQIFFVWCQVLVGCWLSHATLVLVGRESHAVSGSCWMLGLTRHQVGSHTMPGSCWMLDDSYSQFLVGS